ncbi:hypothetical protein [Aurantimonas sp. 22II-16-19i]|uniref:hypothetical protein n=1 Tax=Aurantimonas sp. 22II-16-19i TaxID=1317114 RepID=UPI00111C7F46|nr:hypothetical protein [Aurantimonas sp. 22II-16-19i]
MATTRRPINHHRRRRITPRAVELFRELQAAPSDAAWWAIHGELHSEIAAKPWEWPCLEDPNGSRNYMAKPEALALWRDLAIAADE